MPLVGITQDTHAISMEACLQNFQEAFTLKVNYDASLVEGKIVQRFIPLEDPEKAMEALLRDSKLDYERSGDKFLIVADKRREFSICGYIKDGQGIPLMASNIYIPRLMAGIQSDQNGYFEYQFFGYGQDEVQLSYLGYKTAHIPLKQWEEQEGECIRVTMFPDETVFGEEIVISDYVLPGITAGESFSRMSLKMKQLLRSGFAEQGDVLRNIQWLPGIRSWDDSAANIYIRGASPDQNGIVWEGNTIYDAGHFFGMISSINPFVLDQITVQKGVYHPRYEDRVGGLIQMSLPDKVSTKLSGGFGSNLTQSHAYIESGLSESLSLIVAARSNYEAINNTPTMQSFKTRVFEGKGLDLAEFAEDENGMELGEEIQFSDLNTKVILDLKNGTSLSLASFASQSRFTIIEEIEEDVESVEETKTNNLSFSLSLNQKVRDHGQIRVRSSFSNYVSYFDESNRFGAQAQLFETHFDENSIRDVKFQGEYAFVKGKWRWDAGYQYQQLQTGNRIVGSSSFESEYAFEQNQGLGIHAIYGHAAWATKKSTINVSVKTLSPSLGDGPLFSPRVNYQYAITPHISFQANAGIMYQFVSRLYNLDNDILDADRRVWILANEEDPEYQRSQKIAAGFHFDKNRWLVEVEAYANENVGIANAEIVGNDIDLALNFDGQAVNRGVNVLVNKRWNRFGIWLDYSYQDHFWFMPSVSDDYFNASFQPRHVGGASMQYQLGRWICNARYQWRSGVPFTEVDGLDEDEDEDFEDAYDILYDEYNAAFLQPYQSLDLFIKRRASFYDKKVGYEIQLGVTNLLNHENIGARSFDLVELTEEDDDDPDIIQVDQNLLRRTFQASLRFFF